MCVIGCVNATVCNVQISLTFVNSIFYLTEVRQRIIHFGKNTIGLKVLLNLVPKAKHIMNKSKLKKEEVKHSRE